MYTVDLYLRVRLACHVDGLSQREAASRFGIARETVRKMLLGLIKAHALIHQKTRRLNEAGQIIAELSDYTAVHNLVAEVLSQGIKDTVSAEVRETVVAVAVLLGETGDGVSNAQLVEALALDKGTISRRVDRACELKYLINQDPNRGRESKLVLGEPPPMGAKVLPTPDELAPTYELLPTVIG